MVSPGSDLALPAGDAPAVATAPRGGAVPSRAPSGLAALAVSGLAIALLAPLGAALPAHAPPVSSSILSPAVDGAQSLIMAASGDRVFPLVERGAFAVTVRVAPGLPPYTGGGTRVEWMTAAGIAESDWPYVDYIVQRESSWNPNATNASSGACGLVQALPCSKVPGNGYDPVDNLRWANGYATARYGSWAQAYDFWTRKHWW